MGKQATKIQEFSKSLKGLVSKGDDAQVVGDAGHAINFINSEKAKSKFIADMEIEKDLTAGSERILKRSNEYRDNFKAMLALQVDVMSSSKTLTQKSKDYANQMGEALARIDKVLVKDFEVKLLLLERFVVASKEMADLEKSGALQRIALSFKC